MKPSLATANGTLDWYLEPSIENDLIDSEVSSTYIYTSNNSLYHHFKIKTITYFWDGALKSTRTYRIFELKKTYNICWVPNVSKSGWLSSTSVMWKTHLFPQIRILWLGYFQQLAMHPRPLYARHSVASARSSGQPILGQGHPSWVPSPFHQPAKCREHQGTTILLISINDISIEHGKSCKTKTSCCQYKVLVLLSTVTCTNTYTPYIQYIYSYL